MVRDHVIMITYVVTVHLGIGNFCGDDYSEPIMHMHMHWSHDSADAEKHSGRTILCTASIRCLRMSASNVTRMC